LKLLIKYFHYMKIEAVYDTVVITRDKPVSGKLVVCQPQLRTPDFRLFISTKSELY